MPVLSELATAFREQYPSVTVVLEPGNSYQGLQAVLGGKAELGAVSVPVSGEIWAAPIALSGIAVIVHPDNPLEELTASQLRQVYGGQTWRWKDLGADSRDEIAVVTRQEGSGVCLAFEKLTMSGSESTACQPSLLVEDGAARGAVQIAGCAADPVTSMAVVVPSSAAVVAYVGEHPAAIGYVAQGWLDERVKVLRIEGLLPTRSDVEQHGYHLVAPLYLVATEEPRGAARQFIDFCLSPEGQAIVAEIHVPVRPAER